MSGNKHLVLVALIVVFFTTLFTLYQNKDKPKGVMTYLSMVGLVGLAISIFNSLSH